MNTSELVFVGIGGSVVALNRATGALLWATRLKRYDFVNVVVEEDNILATCQGEIFCLDKITGNVQWHNPLKGYGTGLATIATERSARNSPAALMAEKHNRDQTAAAAAAT